MSGSTLAGTGDSYSEQNREIDGINLGSHSVYLFTDSSEKQQKLFRIVMESLQDPSAAVLYIAGKQGVKGIRFSMKDRGIDVGSIERRSKIRIVDSLEWYLTQSKIPVFKPIGIIRDQFSEFAKQEQQSGYYYITIISETDALVRKGFFSSYRELELDLGKNIALFRAVFICAYDERELTAAGFPEPKSELLSLHASVIE